MPMRRTFAAIDKRAASGHNLWKCGIRLGYERGQRSAV